jgi:hypothetical protein
VLKVGPYRSSKVPVTKDGKPVVEVKKEIEVQLVDQGKVSLELEKPQKVTFRLHN